MNRFAAWLRGHALFVTLMLTIIVGALAIIKVSDDADDRITRESRAQDVAVYASSLRGCERGNRTRRALNRNTRLDKQRTEVLRHRLERVAEVEAGLDGEAKAQLAVAAANRLLELERRLIQVESPVCAKVVPAPPTLSKREVQRVVDEVQDETRP